MQKSQKLFGKTKGMAVYGLDTIFKKSQYHSITGYLLMQTLIQEEWLKLLLSNPSTNKAK